MKYAFRESKRIRVINRPDTIARTLAAVAEILDGAAAVPPFPLLDVPPLVDCSVGEWNIGRLMNVPPACRGYFIGLQPQKTKDYWALTEGSRVWMSVAPMERESNAQMVHEARGCVLVAGLGMGMTTWNLLLRDEVSEVCVVEKSREVLALMAPSIKHWSAVLPPSIFAKLHIIEGDILAPRHGRAAMGFDFVLADIWQTVGDRNLRADLIKIAALYPDATYGAWGIELDFIEWLVTSTKIPSDQARQQPALWTRYANEALGGIKIVGMSDERMVSLAFDAAINSILGG